MPPRIPRIQPEAAGVSLPPQPSLDPRGLAELSTRGTRAIAEQLGVVAKHAEYAYADELRIQKVVQAERTKLETEQALGLFDRQAADAVFKLKADPNIQPEDYGPRIEADLRKVKDSIAKQLKNPAVLPRFEIGAERKITTDTTKAKYDGLGRRLELNKAGMRLLNQDDANLAAAAAPGSTDRATAIARLTGRLQDQVAIGGMSGTEHDAELIRHFGDIEESDVRRDFRDPTKRQGVLDRLNARGHRYLSADKQAMLAHTLQNEADEADRKQRAKDKEEWTDAQREAMRDMSTRAAEKTTSLDEIRIFADKWKLTVEQKEHFEKVYTAPAVEGPSNAEVLASVTQRAHRYAPTITDSEIWRLYDPIGGTGLNRKDAKELVDHVVARRTHLTEYGHTIEMQRYAQGEQELLQGLGIMPNMINNLTKDQEKIVSLALRDYSARAFPTPGQRREEAFAVKNDLIKRYQGVVTPTGLGAPQLRGSLAYPAYDVVPPMAKGVDMQNRNAILSATANALEKARREGRVSGDQYTAEREKWQKLKDTLEADARKYMESNTPSPGGAGGISPRPAPTGPRNPVGPVPYNPKSNLGKE